MNYTKEQISEIISKHAEQRNGINDLLSIMLESMMMAERGEFLREDAKGNKGNGFRPRVGRRLSLTCVALCHLVQRKDSLHPSQFSLVKGLRECCLE